MQELFRLIEDRQEDYICKVQVSFLEIYNEEIRDLLVEPGTPTPRGGLQIREDKSVKVVGLTELRPANADESVGETEYGVRFTSAIARDNIFATQFHPEKSAQAGLQIYRNFVHWNP